MTKKKTSPLYIGDRVETTTDERIDFPQADEPFDTEITAGATGRVVAYCGPNFLWVEVDDISEDNGWGLIPIAALRKVR